MKILNLYSGIGGNRKLWGDDHEIIAVEHNEKIAKIYQDFFPNDEVIVDDAHQYLLDHFEEYGFIWSSPPCPTHSQFRYNTGFKANRDYEEVDPVYPDMRLYQEIILLEYWFEGKYAIENTQPYYELLIEGQELERHLIWSNFNIVDFNKGNDRKHSQIKGSSTVYGFEIGDYDVKNKRKILRNLVNPELGEHILNCVTKVKQPNLNL